MSDPQHERHLTYDDAARETGHSSEAIRKMLARGKLRRGRETNSGRPTVALTPDEIEALRAGRPFRTDDRPGRIPVRTKDRPDSLSDQESATSKALEAILEMGAKVQQALEQDAQRAREEARQDREAAEVARAALEAERAERKAEQADWARRLDGLAAELASMRDGRDSDRRRAMAAIERIQRAAREARGEAAELKTKLDEVLAGQRAASEGETAPPIRAGLLARWFRRRLT